jgi:hypothetical protein
LDGHILTKKKKKVDHNVNGFILRRRVQWICFFFFKHARKNRLEP